MAKKILVVEDDDDLLSVISMRLGCNEFDVITASDGDEALKKAKAERPDLIIMDLIMPKMDGRAVIMELKLDEKTRNIPVIVMSGVKEDFNKAFTMELGACYYMQKPFDPQQLLNRIRALIAPSVFPSKALF